MGFGILSRRESGNEKCPRCSRVNVDFIDLGFGMLGCFECGSVFVRKSTRMEIKKGGAVVNSSLANFTQEKVSEAFPVPEVEVFIPGISVTPMEIGIPGAEMVVAGEDSTACSGVSLDDRVDSPPATFICSVCGKVCKNALGLNSHRRSHK